MTEQYGYGTLVSLFDRCKQRLALVPTAQQPCRLVDCLLGMRLIGHLRGQLRPDTGCAGHILCLFNAAEISCRAKVV